MEVAKWWNTLKHIGWIYTLLKSYCFSSFLNEKLKKKRFVVKLGRKQKLNGSTCQNDIKVKANSFQSIHSLSSPAYK